MLPCVTSRTLLARTTILRRFATVPSIFNLFGNTLSTRARTHYSTMPSDDSISTPRRRLARIVETLVPSSGDSNRRRNLSMATAASADEDMGTLTLGDLSIPIKPTTRPEFLPLSSRLPDISSADPSTLENLHFILQKYLLGQDVFLLGSPGPYARRLAMLFCRMINKEFEYVGLHRDVGETELKQSREIREGKGGSGSSLEYVDSAAVRAAKMGRILIIEGIEKAERGILPILNNLLENREMNLEDGTHIVHPSRFELIKKSGQDVSDPNKTFISAHPDFRVIAIGTPVPPFPGYPLDPPFRSRFQVRYIDPIASSASLASIKPSDSSTAVALIEKVRRAASTIQISHEMRHSLTSIAAPVEIPSFPQTSLRKLASFVRIFPPSNSFSPDDPDNLARLLLVIHPSLGQMNNRGWKTISEAMDGAELGDAGAIPGDGRGLLGYKLESIAKVSDDEAEIAFSDIEGKTLVVKAKAGPLPFVPIGKLDSVNPELKITPRFRHLLTSLVQLHCADLDISVNPPALATSISSSSSSTTLLISSFAALLGYNLSSLHLYKELGGRELFMRRIIGKGGVTSWRPSPLVEGAVKGDLVHLEGVDYLGATVGTLGRLVGEREAELWEGKRLIAEDTIFEDGLDDTQFQRTHGSFRIISTSSKSTPPKDWLTEEYSSMLAHLPAIPMSDAEELAILKSTGCPPQQLQLLTAFAKAYRTVNTPSSLGSLGSSPGAGSGKARRLGTRSLMRIASRLAKFKDGEDLYKLIQRSLLAEFLPKTQRDDLEGLMKDCGIRKKPSFYQPPAEKTSTGLVFPPISAQTEVKGNESLVIPLFDMSRDSDGESHVPHMDMFLDNSQQTTLMRDVLTDMTVLNEHILLMGAQGVGKNKIVDRALMLVGRPAEYVQLHRDTTTTSLFFQTSLNGGVIEYTDSPLLRAVKKGRVMIVDEADKAGPHVVAVFKSLADQGEMTLSDGRRIRPAHKPGLPNDIIVHPDFRMILLANRPGFPFLGNAFLANVGEAFSSHAVSNPDSASEERVLTQLAPDLDVDLIRKLVRAFSDLRRGFEEGTLLYPYSLRELINLVRHLKNYPSDPLEIALRNIFDFDVHRPEITNALYEILKRHGLPVSKVGMDAVREGASKETKKALNVDYKPKGPTDLSAPKYGKDTDKAHVGGNTWAGGTGGRDTAGLGGRGGYMRLFKGHDVHQIPDELKENVPEEIKEKAREMAKQELARRLEEINMSAGEASIYSTYFDNVAGHIAQLHSLLENLAANEEERVWLKRQADGELDESRLTEGLTGETAIYRRRGFEKPELGRPQIKPKRIRFVFDLSASMYRFQMDGRLSRSLETAVMILEAFGRLSRKEKYVIDLVGHSGEDAVIPLVSTNALPSNASERFKVIQKMALIPQFAFAGDHTVEAIIKGVDEVSEYDADDYFLIIISDANFARYGITAEDLSSAMNRGGTASKKVKTGLIAIGEGAEVSWLSKHLPGKAYRCAEASDIPVVLRSILGTMTASG